MKLNPFKTLLGSLIKPRSAVDAKKKQRGFTAVELGATIAGGLLFISVATFGVLRSVDNNRYSAITQTIASDMPSALMNLYSTTGTLTSLTADAAGKNIVVGMGVKATTPWGTNWNIQGAGTASTVQVRYVLGGGQVATKGPTLASSLPTQFPVVSAAAFTSPNLDVTYNVQN